MAEYLKELKDLETGVRWAAQHHRSINRATAPNNAQGVFYLDLLAMCCKLGKGNLILLDHQREALGKLLDTLVVMPLSQYRQTVRSLRSEMEPELREAFGAARPALVRAGNREALNALDAIASMRWEELHDIALLFELSSGLGKLRRGGEWPIHNTLY